MAHVLLMVIGTDGDFWPMARIGSALQTRGHSVTMLANCYFSDRARQAGLAFAAFDTPDEYERFLADGETAYSPQRVLGYFQQHVLPKIQTQYELIARYCQTPDTVLVAQNQSFIIAQLMAERLGLPVVPVFLAPGFLASMALLEGVIETTFGALINRGRADLGLAPVQDWSAWLHRNPRSLALWPDWYAPITPAWAAQVVQTGFVVHEPPQSAALPREVQAFLAEGDQPLLITGGTGRFVGAQFFAVSATACRLLGLRGLLVTRHTDLVPPVLPAELRWFRELPFALLMPRVRAVIHHGGIGTSVQALAACIPQLILPLGADRPENAACLARNGVARALLRARWQPDAVAASLQQLFQDPTVPEHCRDLAERVAQTDALTTACALIESCLAGSTTLPAQEREVSSDQPAASPATPPAPGAAAQADNRSVSQLQQLSPQRLELLARLLAQKHAGQRTEKSIPRLPRGPYEAFPLASAQQRLWFLDQLEPDSAAYTIPTAIRLSGPFVATTMRRSLDALMQRHEVLRTTIQVSAGEPTQQSAPQRTLALPLVDLTALPPTMQAPTVQQLVKVVIAQRFDLARGPLVRAWLFRLADQEHVLLVTLHHIIADGWSLGVLARDLAALYTAAARNAPPALPELPIQYVDYVVWQRAWLQSATSSDQPSPLEAQLAYWRAQLAGLSPLDLPTDHPRPTGGRFPGASQSFVIAAGLTAALQALSRRAGVTLFMLLLAAFQTLLARYSRQHDIAIGTPIANRTRAETEGLIGCFVNTLVLRSDLAGNPPFQTLLERVRDVTLGAYDHQDLPFELLVEALQPERDLARHPLFQVMCVLQNAPTPAFELPGITMRPLSLDNTTSKFDLTLTLAEEADTLEALIEYRADLFDALTITRLRGHFQMLLAGIVADPSQRLAALPLLSAAERSQLLIAWNDTRSGVRGQESEVRKIPSTSAFLVPDSWKLASRAVCVQRLFEAQAVRCPDAVAVAFDEPGVSPEQLTYRELNQRANQLARHLRRAGVGPETPVGLCVERTIALVIGMLGILKAGGAYVPLDPAYPAERLQYMLEDSRAAVLVIQDEGRKTNLQDKETAKQGNKERIDLLVSLSPCLEIVVDLASDWPQIARQPAQAPPTNVCADNLAYVIYTSGSTGRPKGVAISHDALVNLLHAMRRAPGLTSQDVLLAVTTITFDIAGLELFLPLLCGARLELVPRAVVMDGQQLAARLVSRRATFMQATPATWRMLVEAGWPGSAQLTILCGGEALPRELAEQLLARSAALWNMYGPTETTIWSAVARVESEADVMIGRPIANTQIYLLDAHLEPVPLGVPGELYIGGAGLARGYRNRPDLTAERFVPNPFAKVSGIGSQVSEEAAPDTRHPAPDTRLYKTGDLARYRLDGSVEYLGRLDQQVKLRGYRIELGEIATVLTRHPAVRTAVVVLRPERPGDARLVAYVVPTEVPVETQYIASVRRPSSFVTDLRAFLHERLPDYMLPAAFVLLDALPITPSGKLDRRALPTPDRAHAEVTYIAPRTSTEEVLAGIWATVLGREQVGVADNFFALGGHSLLATQVLARMREVFAVELPLQALFERPTIAGLALALAELQNEPQAQLNEDSERLRANQLRATIDQLSEESVDALLDVLLSDEELHSVPQPRDENLKPALQPQPRDAVVPLSFSQQRLWFLDQLEPGGSAFNIPLALRLTGWLNLVLLRRSLNAVICRHEALRTTFITRDGQPVQQIAATLALPLPLLDLRGLAAADRAAQLERLAAAEVHQPFDLARGPLLRVGLARLEDATHVLFLTLHHIIADGWSLSVLIRDLAAYYAARADQPATLPALPIQYADYAIWQRAWLQGAVLAEQLAYWRGQLGGELPILELPTDRPRPPVQTFNGASQPLSIPPALSAALDALSRHTNATLFMTLLASFQTLLLRYTGQNDFAIGAPIANRERFQTEELIGFFLNTLVLRADLRGDPSFRELARQVRKRTLDAYAHQQLPFEKLVEELQPTRNSSYPPLFQVMLILQNVPPPDLAATDLTITALPFASHSAKYDLTLVLNETAAGLDGGIEYNTDLFDPPTITRMAGHFERLLAGIVADPDQRLGALPLLSAAERQQLLLEWNATHSAEPSLSLPALFAAQAARTPDAVALVYETKDDLRDKETKRQGDKETTGRTTNADSVFRVQPPRGYPAFSVRQLTYAELDRRANQLAQHLRSQSVGPEVRVGICLERSPELVVALLGVLKAGGVYVPLDPSYPAARLAFMLADAQAQVLITPTKDEGRRTMDDGLHSDTDIVSRLSSIVSLDADWPMIAQLPATAPHLVSHADAQAYVIYTSGSTGQPKGVAVAQRQLLNRFAWMWQTYPFAPDEVAAQKTAVNFVDSLWELLGPLLQGCPSLIVPTAVLPDLPQFVALLARHQVSRLWLVPSLLAALLDSLPDLAERLPRLRVWVSSGEPLAPDLSQRFAERLPHGVLLNLYGTSEVFDATLHDPRLAAATGALVPIGRPITNVQTYVLDAQLRPVPIGVAGQLYVGGVGLARGYLNRSDRTAERFVPNPFLKDEGGRLKDETVPFILQPSSFRLYKTGDRARYQADGQLVYLGRLDQQLKLRGVRIEPGEIEAALRAHPQVRAAAVLARADRAGQVRLVAYVVTTKDERRMTKDESRDARYCVSTTDLRAFLAARLPEIMLPTTYVLLDDLPLTPSGKLDRQALPAPDAAQAPSAAYLPPRTPTEELLADQWAQLLGLERVGRDDHFFDLGGHSLLATQVIARVRAAFAVELPLRVLFDAPTIAGLAEQIAAARQATPELHMPPLVPAARDETPLSFAQQRLWFLDQLVPGNPFYNIPLALRLIGQPNLRAFAGALAAVVRRHEALRTTFAEVGGRPVQVIAPTLAIALPLIDLCGLPAAIREAVAVRLATDEAQRPFDLVIGPLIRVALLRLNAQEQILLVTLHHIIADGWSLAVLIQELAALYEAAAAGRPAALPALPIQYADYAIWQRAWLHTTGAGQPSPLQAQLAYWTAQLADLPLLNLPTDLPRPPTSTFRGATQTVVLPTELAVALRSLGQRASVTPFMILLASFQVLLARYSGQDDIAVGAPIAGRTRAETEGLIGFFVNTLVLRGDLRANPTFQQLLERVREMTLTAYAHQDVPFELLVEALQPARDLSRTPLFQVMFVLQNTPLPTLELRDLMLAPVALDAGIAAFELKLVVAEGAAGLLVGLEYSTDLFTAATITRMLGHYQQLLAGIVANPSRRVAALPLLTNAERQQLLVEWNDTAAGVRGRGGSRTARTEGSSTVADSACLHELFAAQATRTPDAIAVVFNETKDERRMTKEEESGFVLRRSSFVLHVTYAELDRRANQLAQHLRALGVGPEVRVGIAMARSVELVIALLGVLKAGAAYVPLDPSYPPERLAFMLDDSQARVLISSKDEGRRTKDEETQPESLQDLGLTINELRASPAAIQNPKSKIQNPEAANLAYVIYTSGSTGRPKGVAIAHQSAVALIGWAQTVFTSAQLARVLAATSISFDLSIFELFVPLSSGGTVILVDDVLQLPELPDAQITLINSVPSAMAELLRLDGLPPSVQVVNLAGEPLPLRLVEQLYRQPSVQRVFNLYGPSEDTTYSTAALLARDAALPPTIGRPIVNTQAYVLDRQLQPVPISVPGELYLGGAGLARGYLNRPDLTAERFVPNPFVEDKETSRQADKEIQQSAICNLQSAIGTRLYATGDLVRYRGDGLIEFLGRVDHQVKLRGFRIELGEIEAVLERHPAVRACVVLARADSPGNARLVAYVVPTEVPVETQYIASVRRPSSFIQELCDHLAQTLPDYMIPSAFVLLDTLPLNANGKLNRAALPAPDHQRPALAAAFVAPRTHVEMVIAGIWTRVLALGQVGIDDNFFALGGHSLLATQVVAQLRESFQVALPVRRVFDTPTVAGLATALLAEPRQRRQVERTAELLIQLAQLSEDDVDSLIAERTGGR